jgi:arsenate reductase
MKHNPRELFLYYNGALHTDKKMLAYAQSLAEVVNAIDYGSRPFTALQIDELAQQIGISVSDLVNTEHPIYAEKYADSNFSDTDWLTILVHTPELLRPVAILGEKAILVDQPADVLTLADN